MTAKQQRPTEPTSSAELPRRWTPEGAFWLFCTLHVALWTLVPTFSRHTLPKDTLEGIAWGQIWQLGYDKHPPLTPWISALFTQLFDHAGWPVYLAAQLAVALCFWAIWRLARQMLAPWHALVAVALLEGINYYNTSSYIFNPNVMMLPTWAMLTLTSYQAIRQPTAWRWSHAGLWAGLALLAKYQSAIIYLALLVVIVAHPLGRRVLVKRNFYLGVLIAVIVVSPHLAWLIEHDFLPLKYGVRDFTLVAGELSVNDADENRLLEHLEFLLQQVAAVLPLLLLALQPVEHLHARNDQVHRPLRGAAHIHVLDEAHLGAPFAAELY